MSILITYLLKTTICSAALFIYYRLALYNRLHHLWNRVFLLGAVAISVIIPFLQIPLPSQTFAGNAEAIQLLNVVTSGDTFLHDDVGGTVTGTSIRSVLTGIYFSVTGILVFISLARVVSLRRLSAKYPSQKIGDATLVLTQEKNAPFSFFSNIYWNTQIDLNSDEGADILNHELTHVREWHSADRLFMNLAVAVYWCNPFFWLMRREICQVHEFLADRNSLSTLNLTSFSRMVLRTNYPAYQFDSISHFFSSPIKRRFLMLTKQQHPKANYLSRWLALPVLMIVIAGFAFKKDISTMHLDKPITVVIDAGHGGDAAGAVATDGTREKDLNLAIARKIQEKNSNSNVKIILTRETDVKLPLRELVANVVKQQPDAFISIHVNTGQQNAPGFEFYISARNENYGKESQLLGSLVSEKISSIYKVAPALRKGNNDRGIWVLDAPERNYPAVLVECGNIASAEDLSFLKNTDNQDKIATQILKAIEEFGNRK